MIDNFVYTRCAIGAMRTSNTSPSYKTAYFPYEMFKNMDESRIERINHTLALMSGMSTGGNNSILNNPRCSTLRVSVIMPRTVLIVRSFFIFEEAVNYPEGSNRRNGVYAYAHVLNGEDYDLFIKNGIYAMDIAHFEPYLQLMNRWRELGRTRLTIDPNYRLSAEGNSSFSACEAFARVKISDNVLKSYIVGIMKVLDETVSDSVKLCFYLIIGSNATILNDANNIAATAIAATYALLPRFVSASLTMSAFENDPNTLFPSDPDRKATRLHCYTNVALVSEEGNYQYFLNPENKKSSGLSYSTLQGAALDRFFAYLIANDGKNDALSDFFDDLTCGKAFFYRASVMFTLIVFELWEYENNKTDENVIATLVGLIESSVYVSAETGKLNFTTSIAMQPCAQERICEMINNLTISVLQKECADNETVISKLISMMATGKAYALGEKTYATLAKRLAAWACDATAPCVDEICTVLIDACRTNYAEIGNTIASSILAEYSMDNNNSYLHRMLFALTNESFSYLAEHDRLKSIVKGYLRSTFELHNTSSYEYAACAKILMQNYTAETFFAPSKILDEDDSLIRATVLYDMLQFENRPFSCLLPNNSSQLDEKCIKRFLAAAFTAITAFNMTDSMKKELFLWTVSVVKNSSIDFLTSPQVNTILVKITNCAHQNNISQYMMNTSAYTANSDVRFLAATMGACAAATVQMCDYAKYCASVIGMLKSHDTTKKEDIVKVLTAAIPQFSALMTHYHNERNGDAKKLFIDIGEAFCLAYDELAYAEHVAKDASTDRLQDKAYNTFMLIAAICNFVEDNLLAKAIGPAAVTYIKNDNLIQTAPTLLLKYMSVFLKNNVLTATRVIIEYTKTAMANIIMWLSSLNNETISGTDHADKIYAEITSIAQLLAQIAYEILPKDKKTEDELFAAKTGLFRTNRAFYNTLAGIITSHMGGSVNVQACDARVFTQMNITPYIEVLNMLECKDADTNAMRELITLQKFDRAYSYVMNAVATSNYNPTLEYLINSTRKTPLLLNRFDAQLKYSAVFSRFRTDEELGLYIRTIVCAIYAYLCSSTDDEFCSAYLCTYYRCVGEQDRCKKMSEENRQQHWNSISSGAANDAMRSPDLYMSIILCFEAYCRFNAKTNFPRDIATVQEDVRNDGSITRYFTLYNTVTLPDFVRMMRDIFLCRLYMLYTAADSATISRLPDSTKRALSCLSDKNNDKQNNIISRIFGKKS